MWIRRENYPFIIYSRSSFTHVTWFQAKTRNVHDVIVVVIDDDDDGGDNYDINNSVVNYYNKTICRYTVKIKNKNIVYKLHQKYQNYIKKTISQKCEREKNSAGM